MSEQLNDRTPLPLRDVIVDLGNHLRGEPMTPEEESEFVERVMTRAESGEGILERGLTDEQREQLEAIQQRFENEQ